MKDPEPATSTSPSLAARLRYRFDAALSRGPSVIIGWLGLLTLGIIVISAAVLTAFRLGGVNGGKRLGPLEAFWQSLLRVLDSGSFAADASWPTRILTLVVTLAGIFLAGSLIGLIANAVDLRIEELRKGRSQVIESDHTVILGWSARVPAVVNELIVANASRKRAAVVVLANHDKSEMEEALRVAVGDPRTTRIVCRSGDPASLKDLEIANVGAARSVVVVSGEAGDSGAVKTLLALRSSGAAARIPIVAEIVDQGTEESVRALFGPKLVTVNSDDVVAELTAQACRNRGLSSVFRELLDFGGHELYISSFPELTGTAFADAQLSFDVCSLVGLLRGGKVYLSPPPDTAIRAGDELIGIAEDDSLFRCTGRTQTPTALTPDPAVGHPSHRRLVIVGWSALGPRVVSELDEFLEPGTDVEVLLDPEYADVASIRAEVRANNINLDIQELAGGPEFLATHAARVAFHEVIVLGYREKLSVDDADARTLLTLLAFTQVRVRENLGDVRMVAELLDQRNAPLAEATGADDFVVSDQLTSFMLAQLAERSELQQVFEDLFDRGGAVVDLRPAGMYGAQHGATYAQVVAGASTRGESAIGVRRKATAQVEINPPKARTLNLRADDDVIILTAGSAI